MTQEDIPYTNIFPCFFFFLKVGDTEKKYRQDEIFSTLFPNIPAR